MKKTYIHPVSVITDLQEEDIIATSDNTPTLMSSPSNTEEWNLSKERNALDEMLDNGWE